MSGTGGSAEAGSPTEAGERRRIEDLRFVVVGGYVADCFVNTSRLPEWGQTFQARSIRTSPGGKALNMAVALARMGAQVTAVGVVGDDPLGRDILVTLRREGVDVGCMQVQEAAATAICVCFVGDEGQTAFVWRIGDEVAVRPSTVQAAAAAMSAADAVLITFEMSSESATEAIHVADVGGAKVVVQPAPAFADPKDAKGLPWDRVDVLVPNENEARSLLESRLAAEVPATTLAERLNSELTVPTIVVTLGEWGCVAHADGTTTPYPVDKVAAVDTTGGSDAFTAALVARLTAGESLDEAATAAQTAANLSISQPRGHESMPMSRLRTLRDGLLKVKQEGRQIS